MAYQCPKNPSWNLVFLFLEEYLNKSSVQKKIYHQVSKYCKMDWFNTVSVGNKLNLKNVYHRLFRPFLTILKKHIG